MVVVKINRKKENIMKNIIRVLNVLVLCFSVQVWAEYVHLTWEDDPKTTMTVNWQDSKQVEGKVKYGLEKESLEKEAAVRVEKVKDIEVLRGQMIEISNEIFKRDVKTEKGSINVYKAKLTDLKPGTKYYYLIESEGKDINSFTTAPEGKENFTFIAGGDGGGSKTTAELLKVAARFRPKFFIYAGDMVGGAAATAGSWNAAFKSFLPYSLSMPIMPTPGNHDSDDDLEFTNYQARFALPQKSGSVFNYSFDYGNCHFASTLASGTSFSDERLTKTAAWLEEDLRAADPAKFKIVFAHTPVLSSGWHAGSDKVKDLFAPIFDKYRVDLYIDGHDHGYERSKPVNFTKSAEAAQLSYKDGTCYLVSGGLGSQFRQFAGSWSTAKLIQADKNHYPPDRFYFIKIEVTEDKLNIQAIGKEGQVLDDFNIEKKN
ncbi:MAG: hypothetical protein A2231_04665 [Candidatus Firestonebacteria bacterium RIFOXYA2_FULL_40_8]|nr:MAG: hypothetical protein A2231_04665 [Candidatus Firestonebacteria bacterium RIFOXYA2_FULL_40_8]